MYGYKFCSATQSRKTKKASLHAAAGDFLQGPGGREGRQDLACELPPLRAALAHVLLLLGRAFKTLAILAT